MTEEQKYPEAVAGVLVYNDKGEILLMKGSKFGTPWTIPGGHVELNETCEQAAIREIKEEVGLDIDKLEFLQYQDAIRPPHFTIKKHFIFFDFLGHYVGGEVVANEEVEETIWVDPQKALDTLEIGPTVLPLIKIFLDKNKKEKHSLFGNKCKKCEDAKKECEEYKTGWQRALADYKNLQAETIKRRGEWAQMSEQQILEEFIPVYDHLKLAIEGVKSKEQGVSGSDAWVEGVKHVLRQFVEILKVHGVEEIKTVGEKFDPAVHEAAGEEVAEDTEPGVIIKEIMPGYKMGERVIRAARVIISK
ncbi:MAG: nucleotide exchange factor GrpE [Candidatus Magasanikbacteria bacterium]